MASDKSDTGKNQGKPLGSPLEPRYTRHRFGGVVHDERGVATLLWAPVADDDPQKRRALSIATDPATTHEEPRRKPTDLRKLGEWIKLQREIAARKEKG